MSSKRRPGRLWLLFFGKKRRGFPELLAGTVLALLALALVFGLPGGAALSRYATFASVLLLLLLIAGSLVLVVVGFWRSPRGRR